MRRRSEQPAGLLIGLLAAFVHVFPKGSTSKLAWFTLGIVNVIIWAVIGTLGGSVLAFFTIYLEPDGPTKGRVALVVFALSVVISVVIGIVVSWQGYRRKTAAML